MKSFRILCICLLLFTIPLASQGQVLFEEDFSDGSADGFTPLDGGWTVVPSGRYTVEVEGYEVFAWNYFGDRTWNDYSCSLVLGSRYSSNHILAVRVQPDGDCYLINLRSRPFHDAVLTKYEDGEFRHLVFVPATVRGRWQDITVDAEGPTITLRVDGEELFSYTDPDEPFLEGSLALVALAGGLAQHQVLIVDDIVVTGMGSKIVVPTEAATWSHLKALYR